MRIDAIDLYHVAMPLISPWRTAYGEDAVVESVLVRLSSGADQAWGEASPLAAPCYSPEWAGGAFHCIARWLAPAIVGQQISSGEELAERLAHFKGNSFAKGALDVAWWVLEAQKQRQPLHRLIGAQRDQVDVGADFGVCESIDELLADIGRAYEAGYRRVKLKFRPGWGLEMLREVRAQFPTQTLHIDMNASGSIDQLDMFCRIDDFHLAMIEQPLAYDDLIDHARLQSIIRTPVCLDESVSSLARAQQAIDLGSCKFVNIKPGRVGGLTAALAIYRACVDAGIEVWVGGMLESAIGARIALALALLPAMQYPADLFASSRFYHHDLGCPALQLATDTPERPQIAALDQPGIGAAPDPDRLAAMTLAHTRLEG